MTITEFILARVAEKEDAARNPDVAYQPHLGACSYDLIEFGMDECVCRLPARVLAECEAKREIVERLAQAERLCEANAKEHAKASLGGLASQQQITAFRTHGWELRGRREALRYVVGVLAAVWADHADYREEWRA